MARHPRRSGKIYIRFVLMEALTRYVNRATNELILPRNEPSEANHSKSSDETTSRNESTPAGSKRGRTNNAGMSCDFGGARLRVAVSPQPPLVNCLQDIYGEWLCNGSNIDVIRTLEKKLNFQAEWLVLAGAHLSRPDLKTEVANSSSKTHAHINNLGLEGLLSLVRAGRAWFSGNGFVRTRERDVSGLQLSEPFDAFKIHLLLSKSVRDHDHIFVKPFSAQAWAAIFLTAVLVVPLFYLINTTSSHYFLEADKELARIPLLACLQLARARKQQSSGRSSLVGSTFDLEIERIVSSDKSPALDLGLWQRPRAQEKQELKHRWTLKRRHARRLARSQPRTGFFRLAYVAWYVVASLSAQGGETEDLPRANSTRILIAFWWFYLIVVCSIHAGILTAILTFPKQNDFIQTLDDFLALTEGNYHPMRLSVDKDSELAQLISSPDNLHKSPLATLVHQRHIYEVDFKRHRQRILDEIQLGQGAYLEERSAINLIITQEYFDQRPPKCQFKVSRHPMDSVPMSLALSDRLSAVCRRQINQHLGHIRRSGLAQKWRRKFEPPGNDCLETVIINAGDVPKIELKQVVLAHWFLGSGLLLGAFLLVFEIIWLLTADPLDSSSEESSSSSSSSSSSTSTSSSSSSRASSCLEDVSGSKPEVSAPQLGHKLALRRELGLVSSAPISSLHRRIGRLPRPMKVADAGGPSRAELRRRRRAQRRAQRRARQFRRTVELWTRLREGKLYSEALIRTSGGIRAGARRASQALLTKFSRSQQVPGRNRIVPAAN